MADDSRISCACGYTPPTHTHAEDCPIAAGRNTPTARYVNADRLIERLEQQVASFEQLIPHVAQKYVLEVYGKREAMKLAIAIVEEEIR